MCKLKHLIFVLLATVCMASVAKEYKYQTVKGDLSNTRIYKLDNGLTVYLSVNKEKPRIQTYIAVKTGSRNDPAETTGLAHYLEHLMFKGTKQFGTTDAAAEAPYLAQIQDLYEHYRTLTDPAERKVCYHQIDSISQIAAKYFIPNEYDKAMSSIGANGTNAYTSNDVTCYTEDIPANEVENWLKIEGDRFQNMVIRGFHTELEAVYEEYNMHLSQDGDKVFNALSKKLFPTHPYGTQTTIGTQEHLKNPSIVNIKNYFNRYYCPNNVAICMAGDLDPDKTMALIDKYFGSWKPNPSLTYPQYAPVADLTSVQDTTVIGQEAENIYLGWKFDKAASLQADTLDFISDMLNNGTAGLMDLNLSQQMKCLGAGAGYETLAEYSIFLLAGWPKEGQTLDEVKQLLLGEIDNLKKGNFDDNLVQSVINNAKLKYYTSLESNYSRADRCVDAFIDGEEWSDVVGKIDRISGITKQQIVDFANRHFLDNYAVVYKKMGVDSTQKKIEKPQITAIPANRDLQSQFITELINAEVEPIQPKFVDFNRDLTKSETPKKKLPVLYVQNTENGRFTLAFKYDFGSNADKWLDYAANYADYLGTDKMTAEQIKQKFYQLACSYNISVRDRNIYITLSGLDENRAEAMKLMEDVLANMKVDNDAYTKYVGLVEKARSDNKLNQSVNFSELLTYGFYGKDILDKVPSSKELREMNPQALVDRIKGLGNYAHTILYYGPATLKDLCASIDKDHKTAKKFTPNPVMKEYPYQQTTQNEVWLAPYDAKNIYMVQYNNEGKKWSADNEPVASLFNEYYGGGMNTVVFQELRETRGLAYSAYAEYATPSRKDDPEYAMTYIISQNDKMMDCIHTFNTILDTIPQSEKAFELAKQALLKRLASARTTKFGIINKYISAQRLGIDYDLNEKIYNAVPKLTMTDIVNFEQQHMAKKPYRYLILGNEKDLDIKALEQIAPIKRLTTEDIFGY